MQQRNLRIRRQSSQGFVWQTSHGGFTLVELLIVAAIMLILLTLTIAVYTNTASTDRIRSSARQVQSAFAGARDRAIKAGRGVNGTKSRRGLRLLLDATDPTVVTSMVYVGAEENWTDGQVTVGRLDLDDGAGGPPDGRADAPGVFIVRGWPRYNTTDMYYVRTGWKALYDQGLLVDGARIRIPAGATGTWYTINTQYLATYNGVGPEILVLTTPYQGPVTLSFGYYSSMMVVPALNGLDGEEGFVTTDDDQDGTADNGIGELGAPESDDATDINCMMGNTHFDYELELLPTVLPGSEPLRLSSGIAIDLDNSAIFTPWRFAPGVYTPHMDVMFSTLGSVVGPLSAQGTIHFRLADVQDIAQNRDPADPQATTMLYSTLFTQTGYVATFPVDITDNVTNSTGFPPSDGLADNPLSFARIGSTLGR